MGRVRRRRCPAIEREQQVVAQLHRNARLRRALRRLDLLDVNAV